MGNNAAIEHARRRGPLGWIGALAAALSLLAVVTLTRAQPPSAAPAQIQRGHAVFEQWCAGCHNPDPALQAHGGGLVGQVFAGTYALQQRYHGTEPAALEQRTDLHPAYIRQMVRQGRNLMPRTRKTEVSDADLDAVVAYLTRNNRR
ncbi:MAG TPA: cytochrome c [Steroidobacteraceae bacterium]|jgi:mono/diheme cytochrome c family protein|nr:cytochrome c [Steroidobacteraceae bacterium]